MSSLNTKRPVNPLTLKDYIDQLNKRWERLETRIETLERKTEGLGAARPYYDSKYKETQ